MRSRGYVALEDVSIVIPIAVSIILFFSALAWAISTIQNTNSSVDLTLKAVDLADVFASPGVITDKSFSSACSSAITLANGYGFLVYVTSPTHPATVSDVENRRRTPTLICPASPVPQIPKRTTVITRAFPIPYQETLAGLPYNDVNLLVVTVWKGA